MPIPDKIAAARKISEFLNGVIANGDFHLRYKITVDPPVTSDREWEHPEILVELSGADSPLVLENGGELLRAFEHVSLEMLRLAPDEHEKVSFDCQNFRSARLQELRLAADVAAERVRKSGMPYAFAPNVVARAPHRPPGAARLCGPAHRERRRGCRAPCRGLSKGLQG